jgi:hypothetical protein
MKTHKRTMIALISSALLVVLVNCVEQQPTTVPLSKEKSVSIEFEIHQDMDLIRQSLFGGPPQFAIWLEEPVGGRLQTVFVTYRSARGDWAGKTECPAALPRWFEVFRQETGRTGLPTLEKPAPDAVTGATPRVGRFRTSVQVPYGSRWVCWIEMNQSGDFNDSYRDRDAEEKKVDVHFSGQPPLIYRGEIAAIPGEKIVPALYGESAIDNPAGQIIVPVSDGVTTAKNIFKSIEIRVVPAGQNRI